MTAQRGSKRKKLAAKPDKNSTSTKEKIKVEASVPSKVKAGAKLISEKPLAKAQKALRVAQVEVEHEHQARIKAEKSLTHVQHELAAAQLVGEQGRQAQKKRVSFIVRLTVGEDGQLQRTEIEHVSSKKKQNFLGLDGEHLVAFMKAYISPTIIPAGALYTAPPLEKLTTPTAGLLGPKSSLIVSDVQLFRLEAPDLLTLILTCEEPFGLKAHIQLQGPEAQVLTTQELPFEMKVYANEITSNVSMLLATYRGNLIEDMLEYTLLMEVPGLSLGLYRLFTVITLHTPTKLVGFYDKTIIQML